MGPQLQSIKVNVSARRKPVRGIRETEGTRCHGCPSFECMPTGKRTKPWRLWCDDCHKEVVPLRDVCHAGKPPQRDGRHRQTFGEWMLERMQEEGMTYDKLAQRMHELTGSSTSPQTLCKYARGQINPPTPQRNRIRAAFGHCPGEGGA